MDARTRRLVRDRAGDQCEYCGLSQDEVVLAFFQVEHVIPKQHGGSDDPSNLALACRPCHASKRPNLAAIDPETGAMVPLFHPRRDDWYEHFERVGARIVGKTPRGRATARLLLMNTSDQMRLRGDPD